MDVVGYPGLAYSTRGWMNWAGGDPLLNTFIAYPEGELARILFHELAHQVVYVADDTAFNESFATAVERLGGARWLLQAGEQAQREYAAFDARRQAFRALTRDTRERLKAIYENTDTTTDQKRQLKAGEMARFHAQYAELRQHWDGYKGYDAWVARANNASFGAQAAYDDLVPGFEALFEREGRDFARFYDAVRALARQSPEQRLAALTDLAPALRAATPARTTTP
jgi:predicted aminopeptidase